MEEILGMIIFILYIMTRAMADRSKGMAKKPGTKAKQRPVPDTIPKPARTQAARPAKPQPVVPAPPYKTPEPAYDTMPYMEGVGYELKSDPVTPSIASVLAPAPEQDRSEIYVPVITRERQGYVLTNEDLRKAVIWSEILQKPRFRTRRGYSRY